MEKHADDATSLAMHIEELRQDGADNPVIFSKFQKEAAVGGLEVDDVMIVFQTEMQAEMLKSYGHDKVVCMDATHGTNMYGFLLITILVVDDYGEGYPVAWCITNHETEKSLVHFLNVVKGNLGDFNCVPKWFMSDMAYQYFSAWKTVFGEGPRKLLCIWHVDKAWRSNLSLVTDTEKRALVYKQLRVILEEPQQDAAMELLEMVTKALESDDETKAFAEYFKKEYLHCSKNRQQNQHQYVCGIFPQRTETCLHAWKS